MSIYDDRINSVKKIIKNNDEALLITDEKNVYYFSGVINSEGKLLINKDEAYLLVDFRYIEHTKNICKSCKVVEFKAFTEDVAKLCGKHSVNTLYLEAQNISVSLYNQYILKFNSFGISLISDETLSKAISNLRLIKSEEEIAFIDKAQKITEKAYLEVLNYVKAGETERNISLELEYLIKNTALRKLASI